MEKYRTYKIVSIAYMALALFTTGCKNINGTEQSIEQVEASTLASLIENDATSPSCSFKANIQYLKTADTDSIGTRINENILAISLGDKYQSLPASEALDSFKNEYISAYRKEVLEFYKEDLKNANDKSTIPSWYNFEFMLTTELKEGKEGIFNYTSTIMEYRGGAHPNQWSRWINICKTNGTVVTLDDIFFPTYKVGVSNLIIEGLISEMATTLNDPSIKTLKDLQKNGIFNYSDVYVPDNFLLEKDSISFLYNKYDIAPYSMGVIVISLPYSKLEKYLNHQFLK